MASLSNPDIPILKDKTITYPLTLVILGIPLADEIQYLRAKYSRKSDTTPQMPNSVSINTAQRPQPSVKNVTNYAAERMGMTQSDTRHPVLSYASGATVPGHREFMETYTVQPHIHGIAQNVQCIIHLRFASQAPVFRFLLDTGSRSTWVFSTLMPKEKWESGGYNPPDGKDLVPIQVYAVQDRQQRQPGGYQKYVLTFASYDIISDDLILRAKAETTEEVRLPKVRFGAVVDTDILQWPTFHDGIIGLGTHSDGNELLTILERGIRHEILECPTFEVNVSLSSVSKVWKAPQTLWQTGTVSFGTKPSSRYNRVKALENPSWKIPSHRKKIGDAVFTMNNIIAIDTGTYGIYISDKKAVNAFYRGIPGAVQDESKIWGIPRSQASQHSSWPKLAIELGDGENACYLEVFSRNLSYLARSDTGQFLEGVLQTTELLGKGLEHLEILGLAGIACTRMLFLYDITPWKTIRPWVQAYQDLEGKELEAGNWIYWKQTKHR